MARRNTWNMRENGEKEHREYEREWREGTHGILERMARRNTWNMRENGQKERREYEREW